tara:strand:+ start:54 stop:317 length:264 start_codon:yes stop_codon:yes gene_type:complete
MKDNRIIAEFMGAKFIGEKVEFFNKTLRPTELRYHNSWDWLMPVIEEIDHTTFETVQSVEDALSTRHLTTTYRAVVKFINEYKNLVS